MLSSPACEYLVSHGKSGAFGRFAPVLPLTCRRGERVVIQSRRGLELGSVLCQATSRHAQLLGNAPACDLLRRATPADEAAATRMKLLEQALFDEGRRLVDDLGLALEVLDVEVLLDGQQAIVQHLGPEQGDWTPFVEALGRRRQIKILLENLAIPPLEADVAEEDAHGGCGEPGCGRASGGGCTSCGTGGGCSSCGTGKVDMNAYFAHLRSKMEDSSRRPLL